MMTILIIWAILFLTLGFLANWYNWARQLFLLFCILTFCFIVYGIIRGIDNTIKDIWG